MTTPFARGFRLHLPHGPALDGAELPNGRAFVMDDPVWGLGSTARTVDLLQAGYPGARIEWPDDGPAEHCGHQKPPFSEHAQRTECVLRPGHSGSHADGLGDRWWPGDGEPTGGNGA
ncbi:hypothetical protein [Streptomyces sp. NBC_01237]|uniref:hypothetical protein n=1 Tax=Streptomyces sp. NBC_01237 TaxID=2903790 RepID=UPI002DDC1CB0|nr:hypothetical protein [Streptomyces sp. NBC_01237]WRZ72861.1 hypothetical protein OG251_15185 [Streptomyces sp. NBC_01237]